MHLHCDMERTCDAPVTHIDSHGYVYCLKHGRTRQSDQRCRKLTASEYRTLTAGGTITYERAAARVAAGS